jgi:hypothetical protein
MQVKISGDGAKISTSSHGFVCSFSLLSDREKVMASSGKKTLQ